jgi:hypothetical protein
MYSREWHVSEAFDVTINRTAHTSGEFKDANADLS